MNGSRRQNDPDDHDWRPARKGSIVDTYLPVWAKAIYWLGFPIALCVFLLAQDAGFVPRRPDPILVAEMKAHATSLEEHRTRQEQLMDRLTLAMRIFCQNSAKTQTELNNCSYIK